MSLTEAFVLLTEAFVSLTEAFVSPTETFNLVTERNASVTGPQFVGPETDRRYFFCGAGGSGGVASSPRSSRIFSRAASRVAVVPPSSD